MRSPFLARALIRHLVLTDREEARRQFDALNRIFGRERETDKGNRE